MNTRFGGVCKVLIVIDSSSMGLDLAFVIPSAVLIAPGIRHIELIRERVMHSRKRYPISGIVGTVSLIRLLQSVFQSMYATTRIDWPNKVLMMCDIFSTE